MKKNITISISKNIIPVLFCIVLIACENRNSETKISSHKEVLIVEKCLKKLSEDGSKQGYLVSPRYDSFGFNVFLKKIK